MNYRDDWLVVRLATVLRLTTVGLVVLCGHVSEMGTWSGAQPVKQPIRGGGRRGKSDRFHAASTSSCVGWQSASRAREVLRKNLFATVSDHNAVQTVQLAAVSGKHMELCQKFSANVGPCRISVVRSCGFESE